MELRELELEHRPLVGVGGELDQLLERGAELPVLAAALLEREHPERARIVGRGLGGAAAQLPGRVGVGELGLGDLRGGEEQLGRAASAGRGGAPLVELDEVARAAGGLQPLGGALDNPRVRGPQLREREPGVEALRGRVEQLGGAAEQRLGLGSLGALRELELGAEQAGGVLGAGEHLGEERERLLALLPFRIERDHRLERVGGVVVGARGERGVAEPELRAQPHRHRDLGLRREQPAIVELGGLGAATLGGELGAGGERGHVLADEREQLVERVRREQRLTGGEERLGPLAEERDRLVAGDRLGPAGEQLGELARLALDPGALGGEGDVVARRLRERVVLAEQRALGRPGAAERGRRLEEQLGAGVAVEPIAAREQQLPELEVGALDGEVGAVARERAVGERVALEHERVELRGLGGAPGRREQLGGLGRDREVVGRGGAGGEQRGDRRLRLLGAVAVERGGLPVEGDPLLRRGGERGGLLEVGGELGEPALALEQREEQLLGLGERRVGAERLAERGLGLLGRGELELVELAEGEQRGAAGGERRLEGGRALEPAGLAARVLAAAGERDAHLRGLEQRVERVAPLERLFGGGELELRVAEQLGAAELEARGALGLAGALGDLAQRDERGERLVDPAGLLGERRPLGVRLERLVHRAGLEPGTAERLERLHQLAGAAGVAEEPDEAAARGDRLGRADNRVAEDHRGEVDVGELVRGALGELEQPGRGGLGRGQLLGEAPEQRDRLARVGRLEQRGEPLGRLDAPGPLLEQPPQGALGGVGVLLLERDRGEPEQRPFRLLRRLVEVRLGGELLLERERLGERALGEEQLGEQLAVLPVGGDGAVRAAEERERAGVRSRAGELERGPAEQLRGVGSGEPLGGGEGDLLGLLVSRAGAEQREQPRPALHPLGGELHRGAVGALGRVGALELLGVERAELVEERDRGGGICSRRCASPRRRAARRAAPSRRSRAPPGGARRRPRRRPARGAAPARGRRRPRRARPGPRAARRARGASRPGGRARPGARHRGRRPRRRGGLPGRAATSARPTNACAFASGESGSVVAKR